MLNNMRWHIFRMLSRIGWFICPEPHRTILQKHYRLDLDGILAEARTIDEKLDSLRRL